MQNAKVWRFVISAVSTLLLAPALFAQTLTSDQSGRLIPHVRIEPKNRATGAAQLRAHHPVEGAVRLSAARPLRIAAVSFANCVCGRRNFHNLRPHPSLHSVELAIASPSPGLSTPPGLSPPSPLPLKTVCDPPLRPGRLARRSPPRTGRS